MSRIALALAFALAPLVAACGTSSEAAPAKPESAQAASAGDFQTACMTVMQRNRTCTAEYIPALVDMRARIDKPAGIKDAVAQDRAGVIAKANEEWVGDSTDEVFARVCQAAQQHATPEAAEQAKACMAKDTCAEYAPCITAVMEPSMR
jgi:hypothetical protein